jgi:hypothetical protein
MNFSGAEQERARLTITMSVVFNISRDIDIETGVISCSLMHARITDEREVVQ